MRRIASLREPPNADTPWETVVIYTNGLDIQKTQTTRKENRRRRDEAGRLFGHRLNVPLQAVVWRKVERGAPAMPGDI